MEVLILVPVRVHVPELVEGYDNPEVRDIPEGRVQGLLGGCDPFGGVLGFGQVRNIQLVGSLNWRGAGVSSLEGWLTRSLCVGRAKRERGRPAGASMVFMAVESTW